MEKSLFQSRAQRWVTNRVLVQAIVFLGVAVVLLFLSRKLPDNGGWAVLQFFVVNAFVLLVMAGAFFTVSALVYRAGNLVKKRPNQTIQNWILSGFIFLWFTGLIVVLFVMQDYSTRTKLYLLVGLVSVLLLAVFSWVFMAGMNSNFAEEDYQEFLRLMEKQKEQDKQDREKIDNGGEGNPKI